MRSSDHPRALLAALVVAAAGRPAPALATCTGSDARVDLHLAGELDVPLRARLRRELTALLSERELEVCHAPDARREALAVIRSSRRERSRCT